MDANGRQAVGEFLLHHVLGVKLRHRSALGARFDRLEIAACNCEIVGRGDRHDGIPSFGCVVQQSD